MTRRKQKIYIKKNTTAKSKLPTKFDCICCNGKDSVSCKISRVDKKALLVCKECEYVFRTKTYEGWQELDIYHVWLDEQQKA